MGFDRSLASAMAGTLVLRIASGAMGVLVGLYLKALGVSATVVGLFGAAFFAMELVASPAMGAWSDRYGRKLFMLLGPICGGIAVLITSVTAHVPLLLFTRLLEGLSTASSVPATLSYISDASDHSPRLRGRVVSAFEISTIGGIAMGLVVGGALWDRYGRAAFALDSLVYLVSLVIFAVGVSAAGGGGNADATRGIGDYLRLFRDQRLLSFAPAWLAVNAILGVWLNLLPYLLSGTTRDPGQNLMGGFSGTAIGAILAALILVFAGGILLWGLLFGRLSRARIMLIAATGLFVTAGAAWGLNHAPPGSAALNAALIGVLLVGIIVQSGFTPAALGYLADLSTHFVADRGAVMGLYSVLLALGQLVGSALGGRFADLAGVDGILLLTALLGGATLALVLRLGEV